MQVMKSVHFGLFFQKKITWGNEEDWDCKTNEAVFPC